VSGIIELWLRRDVERYDSGSYSRQRPLYIGLEDTAGNFGILYNGSDTKDTIALTGGLWQELNVGLQDFVDQGVVLSQMKWLYIGLGDRINPTPGGQGQIMVDSIRLYPERCVEQYRPQTDLNGDCIVNMLDFALFASQWLE
jgi:hypothetical protein